MSAFKGFTSDRQLVRKPAVAGQFYSADATELRNDILSYLRTGKRQRTYSQFLIVPHAGYMFSGAVAGIGYATVDPSAQRVFIIGPSHHKWFEGVSIPDVDYYETPLGQVPIAKEVVDELRAHSFVHSHKGAHQSEHCLEVQVPFLQVVLGSFQIIPVLCGRIDPALVAEMIGPYIDENTLVVASSDLSHYHSDDEAQSIDAETLETIEKGKLDGPLDACGETPIRVVMKLTSERGLKAEVLDTRNSYQTAPYFGSRERVVGYASVAFKSSPNENHEQSAPSEKLYLSKDDKAYLLTLAREALDKAVRTEGAYSPDFIPEFSRQYCGCFVTLTSDGKLRGCIGYIEGIKPLYQAVIDNAASAALGDPRFPNVTEDELNKITIELSILTRPVPLSFSDPQDLLNRLSVGEDGLILQKGYRQSTFLPQVWDTLPDKVAFLEHLAMKAGLSKNDWKVAQFKRYRVVHFREE
ncbi:MAG: AmmeMemoRadiSam system protein B [Chitinispirillaceae bacterium]